MKKQICIIGAGPAGLEAAYFLAEEGFQVCLLEKEEQPGGNLKHWIKLFPDFTDAESVRKELIRKVNHQNIELKTNFAVNKLYRENKRWRIAGNQDKDAFEADAVLLATGFDVFDASRKEELGYTIYDNIITSVEFERMTKGGEILTSQGTIPTRIAFLNCVGSRDEKVGNHYCSRTCCINAVKQAIEFKELVPEGEAYVFYMDLRMSGQQYEELYRKSQQDYGVNYIRGRISEASGTINNRVHIKAEDTLASIPLKMTVDLLVLMVGMEVCSASKPLIKQNGIEGEYGYAKTSDSFLKDNLTHQKGLFLAGACKRPLTIPETLADSRAAVLHIVEYLRERTV